MSNRYFNNTASLSPGQVARGTEVDAKLAAVASGLDVVQSEMDDAVRMTNVDITTPQVISASAVTRANKVIGFDSTGALTLMIAGANWRGDWASGQYYRRNEIVRDSAGAISLNSLFVCLQEHTASNLVSEAANWEIMVDVSEAGAYASAAAGSADLAEAAAEDAVAALDSFDDRYLGAKASDPSLDNDGNALIAGALYFNSTAGEMRAYSGSAWVATYLPAGSYMPLSGGELTGDVDFNNNDIAGVKTVAYEGEYDNGNSGTSKTITLTNGQKQKVTLTDATTLTISATGALTGHYQLRLIQDGIGSRAVTWSGIGSTQWLNSTSAPAINLAANGQTIINIFVASSAVVCAAAAKIGAV